MKKRINLVVTLALLFGLFAFSSPINVAASSGDIGNGQWVLPQSDAPFTSLNIDAAAATAPNWLQQLSEGVVITQPAKICYPFRGGQFHWVPQILQLKEGIWTKQDTTKEYLNGDDGMLYYACTLAPSAGTFALFGYYDGPAEIPMKECTFPVEGRVDYWNGGVYKDDYINQYFPEGYYFTAIFPKSEFPAGTNVTYEIISMNPAGSITTGLKGTTVDFLTNIKEAYFWNLMKITDPSAKFSARVVVDGCYKEVKGITFPR